MGSGTDKPRLEDTVGEVVMVRWIDSCEPQENSEVEIFELPVPQDIESYGVLLRAGPDHVVIAGAVKGEAGCTGKDTYDYVIAIPTVSILHWQPLTKSDM
jgi:hypothetical protein|tara:strand:- start:176 stop:475 length:300 start_codon:yes stop_codon:yes gene_type:complete